MSIEKLQARLRAALTRPTITTQDVDAFRAAIDDGTVVTREAVLALQSFAVSAHDKFEPAASTRLEELVYTLVPGAVAAAAPAPAPGPGGAVVSWDTFTVATTRDGLTGTTREEGLRTFDQLAPALLAGTLTEAQRLLLASAVSQVGVMGEAEALRAASLLNALSPADGAALRALLDSAGSPLEQAFIFKALGAGYPVAEVAPFADTIRGWSPARLLSTLNLADPIVDDGAQTGVVQQFQRSCVATVGQALRGEVDPLYALQVRSENPDIHAVDDGDGRGKNPKLGAEQEAVLSAAGGVASARSVDGQGIGYSRIDEVYNACSARTGFVYSLVDFEAQPTVSMGQQLDLLAAQLARGIPTPLLVGVVGAAKCHAIISLEVEGSGPGQRFLLHDPWGGESTWVTREQIEDNQLHIGTLTALGAFHLATPAPAATGVTP